MEMLDTYTRDGKFLGVKSREECHVDNPGFYHKPAWSWVYNSKGEVLVQKRSMNKKVFPGCWDMSCAGHVDAGERTIDGLIREVKEELGVDISEKDCHFEFEYIEDECFEIGQLYTIKMDREAKDFNIQEEEVEQVKWVSFEEFKKMLFGTEWCPYSDEYKYKSIDALEKRFEEL